MSHKKQKLQKTDEQTIYLVEAALYVSGRPLDIETLCSVTKVRSKRKIRKLTRKLAENYSKRSGAIELIELNDGRFVLQLKSVYVPRVRRLSIRPLLSTGPLKTLAYIAYRQPVTQSHVVKVRGRHTYGHIKDLARMGLISLKELGRTKVLATTKTFADYFNLSSSQRIMKRQLEALFEAVGGFKKGDLNKVEMQSSDL
jgi:segregation and condensation protein B